MQDLMKGKRGLIMGIANDHSIAWGTRPSSQHTVRLITRLRG